MVKKIMKRKSRKYAEAFSYWKHIKREGETLVFIRLRNQRDNPKRYNGFCFCDTK